ncbi:MAG: glycosyltransferase family 4 protein [Candidatus Latescibacteria bacterium]|nr:glycosyltransferase family 4 protein [Candidatus Latescibacterota bacterium]
MRIFYLCYENLQEHRGGTRHVIEVVRQLGRLGHTVDLFLPFEAPSGLFDDAITLHVIPTIPVRIIRWLTFYVRSALSMLAVGWRTRPDVIYIREMTYNVCPVLTARLLRRPLVVEVNGPILDEMRAIGAGRLELWLIRTTQRRLFRAADRIVVVAEGLRDRIVDLHRLPVEKTAVIPNGTDPERLKPDDLQACQRAIGLTPGPTVGFLGSCYPYHDLDTLITAAPLIVNACPSVRFVIVGDGYMRPIWMERTRRERLADHFVFTGVVPYDEVPRYLNAFTVGIALFAQGRDEKLDRSPMKLYDYMACGRPVVATDLTGIGDVVRDHQAGLTIPPSDAAALADAVLRLLDDEALCETMGRAGRAAVERQYNWTRVATDIVHLVQHLGEKT